MTTEAGEVTAAAEGQEQEALNEQQQEAAFEAGFAEARGEEPPAEAADAAPTEAAAAESAESGDEKSPLLAGLTEDQLRDLLAKAGQVDSIKAETDQRIRQVFGKVGEINSLVQQLQQSRRQSPVKLNPDSLKRTYNEFPEMAQMLAEDLNDALASAGPAGPAYDPAQVDQIVNSRLTSLEDKIQKAVERRLLTREHRDWETVTASPEFQIWTQSVLPKAEAEQLGSSWDAGFISEKLTEFKSWREKAKATSENKQKRLLAAVTPRSAARGQSTAITEEEAFLNGFKKARG